jgi:uncharacterized Zn finger protein (UPF0148 family)
MTANLTPAPRVLPRDVVCPTCQARENSACWDARRGQTRVHGQEHSARLRAAEQATR